MKRTFPRESKLVSVDKESLFIRREALFNIRARKLGFSKPR